MADDRRYGLIGNTGIKVPVTAASTAALTLAAAQTVDGVACVSGNRVLVKNQASGVDNGIYVVDSGAWSRAADCDGAYDLVEGSLIKVNSGSTNIGFWYCSTSGTIVVGTTSLAFAQASSVLATFTAYIQTLLAAATAAAARLILGVPSTSEIQNQTYTGFTTAGSATAYTLTPSPAITAYAANQEFDVTFHVASGAAPTLAISGVAIPPTLVKGIGDGSYANIESADFPAQWTSRVKLLGATQALVRSLPAAPDAQANFIINGDMVIDQRNEGASTTPTVHPTYCLDRWGQALQAASKYSVQRVADAPSGTGLVNSLKITSLSAYAAAVGEEFGTYQQIIGFTFARMRFGNSDALSVAIAFWVKSTLTGTFSGRIKNNASNRSYIFNYTINAANTWERKSVAIAGDTAGTWTTDKTIGCQLYFDLGGGSNYASTAGSWQAGDFNHTAGSVAVVANNGATWQVSGVDMRPGDVPAWKFMARKYETERRLCEYYYRKTFTDGTAPAQNAGTSLGEFGLVSQAAQNFGATCEIEPMRTGPTLVTFNPSVANANWRDVTAGADRTFTGAAIGNKTIAMYGATGSVGGDTRIQYTLAAEL